MARCISLHSFPTKGMEFPETRIAFMQSLSILLPLSLCQGLFPKPYNALCGLTGRANLRCPAGTSE